MRYFFLDKLEMVASSNHFLRPPCGFKRHTPKLCLVFALMLTACGSSIDDVLFIETPTSIIKVGERISLTAQATEVLATQPEWEVQELQGGSLLRTTGHQVTYLAPPYAGTYRVIARATRINGQSAKAVQVILVQPHLSIEPASIKLAPGDTFAFSVKVRGTDSLRIQWSIDEPDGGSITQEGVYTAPYRAGFYNIVATAQTDGQPFATAIVRVE